MERNNRLIATMHRVLKKNSLYCLFLLLPILAVFSSCAIKHTFEIVGFMKVHLEVFTYFWILL